MIKDQVNLDQVPTLLHPYCHSCKIKGHDFLNCNQIHYVADKDFIIKRSNFSYAIKERTKFVRTHKKRKNALMFKQKLDKLKKRFGMKAFLSFIDQRKVENTFENKNETTPEKPLIRVSNEFHEARKEIIEVENIDDKITSNISIDKFDLKFGRSEEEKSENSLPEIFMMDFERSVNFEKYYPERNLERTILGLKNQWSKGKKKYKQKMRKEQVE